MTNDIVIVVNDDDGIEAITGQDVRLLELGRLHDVDYDTACDYINTILESNLDGPAQMEWVKRIAEEFLTYYQKQYDSDRLASDTAGPS